MPDKNINDTILKDKSVNEKEKYRATVYLAHKTFAILDQVQSLTNIPTRNAAIEAAVDFYYGYLTGSISQDYLCGVLGSKLDGLIGRGNDRMAKLLYKQAVETNMLTRILARDQMISKTEYDSMRRKAVQDVKENRGIISLTDVLQDEENFSELGGS